VAALAAAPPTAPRFPRPDTFLSAVEGA
jgi:hypothetical protein